MQENAEQPIVSAQAITAEENFSLGVMGSIQMRADAMQHIDEAIATDENFALARIVKAWMLHSSRDNSAANMISQLLSDAERCLPNDHGREYQLWKSLVLAKEGKVIEGASLLEQIVINRPTDLLAHQLVHEEVFWLGNAGWMREIVERSAPAWKETTAGYGSFLAFRAFANEEAGFLDDAERYGRQSVEIDESDIWGAHAVAHVLIMKGEMQRGIKWLENLSANWLHGNQMRHHLWWHVCLFLLEMGQYDRVIELLTKEIRNPDSPLVQASPSAPIDIQNLASLLMRLELYGVRVDSQWQTLGTICANRVGSHGNAFGNIHDIMVLAATEQFAKAEELLGNLKRRYQGQAGHLADSYNKAGIPACEAIVAHQKKDFSMVLTLLANLRHNLHLIGASHAQRDVFFHLLVHAADQTQRHDLRAVLIDDIARIGFCNVPDRAAYRNT